MRKIKIVESKERVSRKNENKKTGREYRKGGGIKI